MSSRLQTLRLLWSSSVEPPTLGGGLTLRMEAELLLKDDPEQPLSVHIPTDDPQAAALLRLFPNCFESSAKECLLVREWGQETVYPNFGHAASLAPSYHSTKRVAALSRALHCRPLLSWGKTLQLKAHTFLAHSVRPTVCLHLKRVAPFAEEQSNAAATTWLPFLKTALEATEVQFLLLGDDPPFPELTQNERILHAGQLGLSLPLQLCIAAHAQGYLAMASGLASAALFSNTPYALFKHPAHHAEAMQDELGEADHLSFAGNNQKILREIPTENTLMSALQSFLK